MIIIISPNKKTQCIFRAKKKSNCPIDIKMLISIIKQFGVIEFGLLLDWRLSAAY